MTPTLPAAVSLLLVALVGAGTGTPAQAVLEEAGRARAQGRVAEAVTMLLAAAEREGGRGDAFADDCLAEAARWLGDDLHDPVRARSVWARLVERHPGSRHVRRAKAAIGRLDALGLQAGGGKAAAELLRIQRNPGFSADERRGRLLALKAAYPEWAGGAKVEAMLAAIEGAGPEPAPPPGPTLPLALLAGLLAVAGWGRLWRRPAEVLLPVPAEVGFLAPIYAVLALAALAQPAGGVRQLLSMLAVVGGGTLAWTWVTAAALRRRPASSRTIQGAIPAGAAAFVVGLCVYAVLWQGLGAEVLETLQGGPER